MTVLFLYTELADYFLKCCDELAKQAEVHIVRWPVNKEAPFQFTFSEKIKIYDKNNYTLTQLKELVQKINPGIIICSGWIDKDYLSITKSYHSKIPTVLTCDTHWKGTLKQYLAVTLGRFYLQQIFSNAWVPGQIQANYVSKLGFKKAVTNTGFYCCDLEKFNAVYTLNKQSKENNFPKRFLYVGRYYNFKGINNLWQAFIELKNETNNDWELWCLGVGDIEPVKHNSIRHFGFVQPNDLEPIVKQCGVFVLPSLFEPWGVVVQEYAASGFPLILSNAVGASEAFLSDGENGFSFPAGNVESLKNQLKKIMNLSSKELLLMSDKSHEKAQTINRQNWATTIIKMYNGFQKK
ncbi:MAG: glycosyltransferase [Bacteroidia bacterium]|nr:glycosyltransferase [Bacteroidia bacterium]